MTASPFADLPVVGSLPLTEAVAKLREVGEDVPEEAAAEVAAKSRQTFALAEWWPFRDRAWRHTAHSFGFLPAGGGGERCDILGVGEVEADRALQNQRLRITLNALRVADYPGGSTHRVLFNFYARNQVPGTTEDLHFNATYRVREGERAAVRGHPIFVGLGVGSEGMALRFHTINVKNDADEAFLDFLEAGLLRSGLKLATAAQPAIAPLSGLALGLTKSVAKRKRNVSVQDCYLGLDFAGAAMGARLALGDYIAVQIPESLQRVWDWQAWVYEPRSGVIVSRDNPDTLIPYNYVAFGVSRYDGE